MISAGAEGETCGQNQPLAPEPLTDLAAYAALLLVDASDSGPRTFAGSSESKTQFPLRLAFSSIECARLGALAL